MDFRDEKLIDYFPKNSYRKLVIGLRNKKSGYKRRKMMKLRMQIIYGDMEKLDVIMMDGHLDKRNMLGS